MIGRIAGLLLLAWALGFAVFMTTLPRAAGDARTDAIVVPTGAPGRIGRGLALLDQGQAKRLLVTGIGAGVRRADLARVYGYERVIDCCVDLGREAVDTRSNAEEIAGWVRRRRYRSIRLVTSDWHAPRVRLELSSALDPGVTVVVDGVPGQPSLTQVLNEYHKLLLRRVAVWLEGRR